jgi:hypothetical protein
MLFVPFNRSCSYSFRGMFACFLYFVFVANFSIFAYQRSEAMAFLAENFEDGNFSSPRASCSPVLTVFTTILELSLIPFVLGLNPGSTHKVSSLR